jgi:hypothetical protein
MSVVICVKCGKEYNGLLAEVQNISKCYVQGCGGTLTPPQPSNDVLKLSTKEMVVVSTNSGKIPADIQAKVDEYIELDAAMKKLNAQLKAMRPDIEAYMENNDIDEINGSHRGKISLVPRNMPIMNTRYTSYDVEAIMPLLPPKYRRECIVKVVDKEVLEMLVKTNKVPKSIQSFKLSNPSRAFTISHL